MRLLNTPFFNPWPEADRFLANAWKEDAWHPAFDIQETDAAFVLRGDIPGMDQKDIEVRVDEAVLVVRGERKAGAGEAGEDVRVRRERPQGRFVRRFRLPEDVDAAAIEAAYANGVLELSLPRRKPVDTTRLIPVQ